MKSQGAGNQMRAVKLTYENGDYTMVPGVLNLPRVLDRYLTETVTFTGDNLSLTVYWTGKCVTCGTDYEDASRPQPMFCPSVKLNRHFGYVLRVCRECYYYIEKSPAPRSVAERLAKGHTPRLVTAIV